MINCALSSHFSLPRHQYPAVAYILIHWANWAFEPKSGFKNICQTRACDFELGSGSDFKMRPIYNSTAENFCQGMAA